MRTALIVSVVGLGTALTVLPGCGQGRQNHRENYAAPSRSGPTYSTPTYSTPGSMPPGAQSPQGMPMPQQMPSGPAGAPPAGPASPPMQMREMPSSPPSAPSATPQSISPSGSAAPIEGFPQ